MGWGRRAAGFVAGAAVVLVAAGCGDAGDGAASGGGGSSSAVVAEAVAAVEKNRQGTDRALPSSAPRPQSGKNVWVISCLQTGEGCSAPAAGAKEAGESIGWKVTVFDGKGSPDMYATGIRSAVADGADGIILDVVDCLFAKSALQEARKAGVKIFAFYSFDCNDPLADGGGEPLFDAEISYGTAGKTWAEYVDNVYTRSIADYIIASTKGEAKMIEFTQDDLLVSRHYKQALEKRIAECSTCSIVKKVPFTLAGDLLTGKLQGKAAAALTQSPQANVLYAPYDSVLSLGVAQAVVGSGRNDDLLVIGNEGLTLSIAMMRENKGQDFMSGSPARWVGWAAIDGMNRLLQGQPQVDAGIGLQTLDRQGPLPKKTTYYDGNIDAEGNPKQDYEANYKKIWGGS